MTIQEAWTKTKNFFKRHKKEVAIVGACAAGGIISLAVTQAVKNSSNEEIDSEKLPFHVCTAMCVMCFLSWHVRALEGYRIHFALLGFVSNLVYFLYPAGVMWYAVHPLCYRVVQTLLFHGVMTAYGLVTLAFDETGLRPGAFRRDVYTVAGMTFWAMLGNVLYTGSAGTYDHNFNWFFVTADPFGLLPERVAPFVMPFLNMAAFLAVERLIYAVAGALRRRDTPASRGRNSRNPRRCGT